jgi:effector-binding domain-containing protein
MTARRALGPPISQGKKRFAIHAEAIDMKYEVRLERSGSSRPLAVVRRRASLQELPKVVPASCGVVWNVIRDQKIKGAGRHVALYLDDQINLEVGVELDAPFAGHGEVIGSAIPSGTVATTTHFGSYGRLFHAHQAIRDWCGKQGYALAGPNWEIYGHWVDAWNSDPSKIRTDVFYLLTTGGKSAAVLTVHDSKTG